MSMASYYLLVTGSNLDWETMRTTKRKFSKEYVEELMRQKEHEIRQLNGSIRDLQQKMVAAGEENALNQDQLKAEYENQIEKYQMQIEGLTNDNLEFQQRLQERKKGEKVHIHPQFSDRIFEVCCMIGMEHYMFGQITRNQLVEEKLLRLKRMDNVYKNANESMKRRMEDEVRKKAVEFFKDYYKSHGLFIVYGDVETILSENRSKVLGLEKQQRTLLDELVPGRLFLDENTKDYLKRISVMDGAVCVDPFGIVQAAARYLIIDRELTLAKLPSYPGFGTKNLTAQCITGELNNIVGYTISGRSKLVRQFENGEMLREFNPITGRLSILESGEIVEQFQFNVQSFFKGSEEINEHIDLINQIMEEQLGQKNKEIVESVMYKLHKINQHRHIASKQFYLRDGRKVDSPDTSLSETHVAENGSLFQFDVSQTDQDDDEDSGTSRGKKGKSSKGKSSRKKKSKSGKMEQIEVTT